MTNLETKIANCKICGNLLKPATNSFIVGKSKLLVVGESPAKNGWIKTGRAFYDENNKLLGTGRVLNKLLEICNSNINEISFTECCKCYIENRKNLEKCSLNCQNYLFQQIAESTCSIILPMGIFPTQILLNTKIKKLSDVVGKEFKINFDGVEKIVIPIFHTSPINPKGYVGNVENFNKIKTLLRGDYE